MHLLVEIGIMFVKICIREYMSNIVRGIDMAKKASIKDVAALAGVSPTTVSQVINKKNDHFPEETIERVMDAVRQLGYVPNQSAKSLRGGGNPLIGVMVPSLRNPFFSDLMQSMQNHAHNLADLVFISVDDDEIEQGLLKMLERGVNGLVIARMLPNALEVDRYLQKQGIPYVVLDQINDSNISDHVKTDEFTGGQVVARHLVELGHKKIALLHPDVMTTNMLERISGFTAVIDEQADVEIIEIATKLSKHGGLAIANKVAASGATAAFTLNDEMGIGLLRGLKNGGVRVPEDISVIGYDNTDYAEFTVPSLTTVTQAVWRMGQLALDMVLARLKDPALPMQEEILDVRLIQRESTAPAPTK